MPVPPEDPRQWYVLASLLKQQILELFRQPYDPKLLRVWPDPDEPRISRKLTTSQRRAVAKRELARLLKPPDEPRYYEWLRAAPTRPLLLAAWYKISQRAKRDMTAENAAASRLLRHMFTLYCGPEFGATIARHTTGTLREQSRQQAMADLLGAPLISVRANHRLAWNIEPGDVTEIETWAFIHSACQYARSPERGGTPLFEAIGRDSIGWNAHNCWRLLDYLGQQRRNTPAGEVYQSVMIVTALRALDMPTEGNRYMSICRLLDGLARMHIVSLRHGPKGRMVRLHVPKVKRIFSAAMDQQTTKSPTHR